MSNLGQIRYCNPGHPSRGGAGIRVGSACAAVCRSVSAERWYKNIRRAKYMQVELLITYTDTQTHTDDLAHKVDMRLVTGRA